MWKNWRKWKLCKVLKFWIILNICKNGTFIAANWADIKALYVQFVAGSTVHYTNIYHLTSDMIMLTSFNVKLLKWDDWPASPGLDVSRQNWVCWSRLRPVLGLDQPRGGSFVPCLQDWRQYIRRLRVRVRCWEPEERQAWEPEQLSIIRDWGTHRHRLLFIYM